MRKAMAIVGAWATWQNVRRETQRVSTRRQKVSASQRSRPARHTRYASPFLCIESCESRLQKVICGELEGPIGRHCKWLCIGGELGGP